VREKNVDPFSCDQWWSSHWVKAIFFFIFTFEKQTSNLRGTFVENVKSQNQPPLYWAAVKAIEN
jgi:hypothetical protein